jgi:hypothetical protein
MYITIYRNDEEEETYHGTSTSFNNDELITYLLDNRIENIDKVKIGDYFVKNKSFSRIQKKLHIIKPYLDDVDVEIKELGLLYKLFVTGTLINANSIYGELIRNIGVTNRDFAMVADSSLIRRALRGRDPRYDYSDSVILRFLSEQNGNISYSNVYRILRVDLNSTSKRREELKSLLEKLFSNIYGDSLDKKIKAKELKRERHLNLSGIDLDKLNKLDAELQNLLGDS